MIGLCPKQGTLLDSPVYTGQVHRRILAALNVEVTSVATHNVEIECCCRSAEISGPSRTQNGLDAAIAFNTAWLRLLEQFAPPAGFKVLVYGRHAQKVMKRAIQYAVRSRRIGDLYHLRHPGGGLVNQMDTEALTASIAATTTDTKQHSIADTLANFFGISSSVVVAGLIESINAGALKKLGSRNGIRCTFSPEQRLRGNFFPVYSVFLLHFICCR